MSETLPKQFDYEYRVTRPYGDEWHHVWLVHGPTMTLHFHFTYSPESEAKYGTNAGLECHYRTPPGHMRDRAPSHQQCHVIHAPCWHDGTSLYANEKLYPLVNLKEPLEFFFHLAGEMARFAEGNDD